MDLTDDDVRSIIKLLDTSGFSDLQLETDQFRLTLQRTAAGGWTQETETLRTPLLVAAAAVGPSGVATDPLRGRAGATPTAAAATPTTAGASRTDAGSLTDLLVDVTTPLPGTFYRSPKPGSPPFVEVGQRVETETVVAIVETMKLMNSVYAGRRGSIAEICLADAEFAMQDAVLMRIKPTVS
jgi:acetyl-CoA carboxylase biotin carboxyl carrier protein